MQIDGERMRLRRLELRLSQEKLAEKTGISQSVITKLESGKLKGRIREQQDSIAKALNMTVQELCGAELPATVKEPTAAPADSTLRDAGPVDDVLAGAWDVKAHRLVDVLVVRLMLLSGRVDPEVEQARRLLGAAASLRSRGVQATPNDVALEVAKAPVSPSADAKPDDKPKKTRAA
ncbi:MAG: helix-turn-helix transcriptional regulator [Polyangiales bacterium]